MESRRLREKIRVPHVDKLELQLTIRPAASMMVGERGRVREASAKTRALANLSPSGCPRRLGQRP